MTAPQLYLGSHVPSWLATADVPLFVSRRRLARLAKRPVANTRWALDSGGFSELSMFGGWQTTPAQYLGEVVDYDTNIGNLDWAAPQDWMCEPDMLAKTGLTVADHQARTVESYVTLSAMWADVSDQDSPFMPVLQGWEPQDYLVCAARYADAGVDLAKAPLVGVGSVCRRQATTDIAAVFQALADADPDMPLHGFGVKTAGLRLYGHLLASCDSLAWSLDARRAGKPTPGCPRVHCGNCYHWAARWRRNIVGPACLTHGEPCDGNRYATCNR